MEKQWRGGPDRLRPFRALADATMLLRALPASETGCEQLVPVLVPAAASERCRAVGHSIALHIWQCGELQCDAHHAMEATSRLGETVPAEVSRKWRAVHRAGNAARHDGLYSNPVGSLDRPCVAAAPPAAAPVTPPPLAYSG